MSRLNSLGQCRLKSITRREYDWVFLFDRETNLTVACLWRLLEGGRVRFTSQDDGHQFGLPAPVDCTQELTNRLCGVEVKSVELRDGVLDLAITFGSGHVLQFLPDSSGYEAWIFNDEQGQVVAQGGGQLSQL